MDSRTPDDWAALAGEIKAWGAALVLIMMVLSLNVVVRLLTRKRLKSYKAVKKTWKARLSLSG